MPAAAQAPEPKVGQLSNRSEIAIVPVMTSEKLFQRRIEDFACEHCGAEVKGNGYTNHCPHCLWSKHVDINPGDRAANCQGAMEPYAIEVRGTEYAILHRCVKCGFERKNRSVANDDFEAILAIAKGKI